MAFPVPAGSSAYSLELLCSLFALPFRDLEQFQQLGTTTAVSIPVMRDLSEIPPASGDLMPDKLFEIPFPNPPPQPLEYTHPKF